jgi:hypothetical protein
MARPVLFLHLRNVEPDQIKSSERPYYSAYSIIFSFDNKPKFEGAALKLYREYQQEHDPQEEIFDRIAFGSRKKYKPLQTADLLVVVINHRFEEMTRGVGPELSKMKKPMDVLFKKEIAITFPTAELLKEFADFAQRHPLKV